MRYAASSTADAIWGIVRRCIYSYSFAAASIVQFGLHLLPLSTFGPTSIVQFGPAAGLVQHWTYLLLLSTFGLTSIVQFGLLLPALSNIGLICCYCSHSDLPVLSNSDGGCRPCHIDISAISNIHLDAFISLQSAAGNRTAAAGLVTFISLQSATFISMHLYLCNQQQAIARRLPASSHLYLCNQQHSFRCIYISAISSRQSHGMPALSH
jgi:hypothetical protein